MSRETIFDRTAGRCHVCGKNLCRSNYGRVGCRGAWEIEHSVPRALGGTDHGNNLFAACISCNRAKGTRSSRAARAEHGRCRAPLSAARQDRERARRAVASGALVAMGAAVLGAPVFVPAAIAAALGYAMDPEA